MSSVELLHRCYNFLTSLCVITCYRYFADWPSESCLKKRRASKSSFPLLSSLMPSAGTNSWQEMLSRGAW